MTAGQMMFVTMDKRAGMQPDEISRVISKANTAGFTMLKRTRVGFRGQILEMIFEKRREDDQTQDIQVPASRCPDGSVHHPGIECWGV